MNSELPSLAKSEPSFHVTYERGRVYNRDLAGAGTVAVRSNAFVFRGRQRRVILSGAERELVIQSGQIWNVIQSGGQIAFSTSVGRSGEKQQPFVFFCENETDASALAQMLPSVINREFSETHAFQVKLQQLATETRTRFSITHAVIAANVVAYVIMGFLGAGWLETASMKPYMWYVANNGAATTGGEWWRLVTAMFVHYGLLHLVLNMWALLQVGHLVERLLGRTLFAITYLGSGIAGSLATIIWHGDKVWSAGASGAVFGIYGALLGYLWREKHGMPKTVLQPLMTSTLTFAGYNLVFGAVYPHVDNVAHVGGLLGGVLFGWICAMPPDREVRLTRWWRRALMSIGALAIIVALGAAVAPRFNYRIRDQLVFEKAMDAHAGEERLVLDRGEKAFAAARSGGDDSAAMTWLRDEAAPFYERWRGELLALRLSPGRIADRRDALARVFDMKVKSYRGLEEAVRRQDMDGAKKFGEEQQAIAAAIKELAQTK